MTNNPPLVSVIIPTYQRSDFLIRAVRSVLNQTYKNIEILIVDDNQKNDSYSIATKEKLEQEFSASSFTYIRHDINKDVSAARNTGIKCAKGQIIAFIDDDDEWLPSKLEKQILLFNSLPEYVGVVSCGWYLLHEVNFSLEEVYPNYRGDLSEILAVNHFSPPSMFVIKRSFLELAGYFDEDLSCSEDIELLYRLSKHCFFDYVDECLVKYFSHPESKSRNFSKKLSAVNLFIGKHKLALIKNKLPWSEIHERRGDLAAASGDQVAAAYSFLTAYVYRPKRIQILGKLALSFLGSSNYVKIRKL